MVTANHLRNRLQLVADGDDLLLATSLIGEFEDAPSVDPGDFIDGV
jgi:hypothetical protein